jgi:MFS family permease
MESGVIFGVSAGVSLGLLGSMAANWREYWKGIVAGLLTLSAFAIGGVVIDTFFWPLPLSRYGTIFAIAIPLGVITGAARLAYRLRYQAARRAHGAKPVTVVKHPPAHDR